MDVWDTGVIEKGGLRQQALNESFRSVSRSYMAYGFMETVDFRLFERDVESLLWVNGEERKGKGVPALEGQESKL